MEQVRLGIIGVGNMGTGHAKNLVEGKVPRMKLAAVADVNPARLEWAKENLPEDVARFATAEEMMDSGLIDAVIVAVPHYFHPPLSMMAMKKGFHVMRE